jgi:starch synthase
MKIALVSSEVVPFSKTGGLADVCGALPKALGSLGHEVVVITPLYGMTDKGKFRIEQRQAGEGKTWASEAIQGVRTYFIENNLYYDREGLYGTAAGDYSDNAERFAFFSRSALALLKQLGFAPEVLHGHDWQSGLIPAYLRTLYGRDAFFGRTKTAFTIHNLAYQGRFPTTAFPLTGLPEQTFTPEGLEYYGDMNYLKAGLVYSDVLTTVSPRYAQEIQTREFGCGLEGVLQHRRGNLFGILNGIDYSEWNPESDVFLPLRYGPRSLQGKAEAKRALQGEKGLSREERVPLVGMISRLADQKGFDLLDQAADAMLSLGVQLAILGTGDQKYQDLLARLKKEHPGQVSLTLGFDNTLAHKIYAGSDLFLMPSRYEPCGLGQMIALKYGTVPVVRETGGLADSIQDADKSPKGNGFSFQNYEAKALVDTLSRAVAAFRQRERWPRLVQRAMACDFSWAAAARKYAKVFENISKGNRRNA